MHSKWCWRGSCKQLSRDSTLGAHPADPHAAPSDSHCRLRSVCLSAEQHGSGCTSCIQIAPVELPLLKERGHQQEFSTASWKQQSVQVICACAGQQALFCSCLCAASSQKARRWSRRRGRSATTSGGPPRPAGCCSSGRRHGQAQVSGPATLHTPCLPCTGRTAHQWSRRRGRRPKHVSKQQHSRPAFSTMPY